MADLKPLRCTAFNATSIELTDMPMPTFQKMTQSPATAEMAMRMQQILQDHPVGGGLRDIGTFPHRDRHLRARRNRYVAITLPYPRDNMVLQFLEG